MPSSSPARTGRRGFLICDNAMREFSTRLAKSAGRSADEVHPDLVGSLVPGAVLVPAMIIAINRAQEHGCSYLYSG